MKNLIYALIIFPVIAFSHDYEFTDKYGRITGYGDIEGDKIVIKDKYGRKNSYIEDDEVQDVFGNTTSYIKKKD